MTLRRVVVLLVMSSAGCMTSSIRSDLQDALKPLNGKLPACTIDVDASEVSLRVTSGDNIGFQESAYVPYKADILRRDIADVLGRLCSLEATARPARFRLRGSAEGANMTFVATVATGMNLLWALLWLPTGGGDSELILDYEYDGKVYSAKASESVTTGFWYNQMSADDAFVDAFEAAMKDVARQMGVAP